MPVSLVRYTNFVGRDDYKTTFRNSMAHIPERGSSLIFYSGVGGIGKTALIKELVTSLTTITSTYKYASYDFSGSGADMITTLNALKKIFMDNYSIDFPLYEKGCLYHYQKLGDVVNSNVQIQKTLDESSVVKSAQKYLEKLNGGIWDIQTVGRAASILTGVSVELLSELGNTSTILRASKLILDKFIE